MTYTQRIQGMVINPIVEKEGVRNDIYSANLEQRIVYLVGEITDEQSMSIVAQLLHLDSLSHEDIQLYINTPGGSVSAGMAIYDTMQNIRSEVCTVGIGIAASMGAVILSGGTRGKRSILPHAEVMIHQPLGGASGQASDIIINAAHIQESKKMLAEILAENCKQKEEDIAKYMDRDHWMKAEAAKSFGIVDQVL